MIACARFLAFIALDTFSAAPRVRGRFQLKLRKKPVFHVTIVVVRKCRGRMSDGDAWTSVQDTDFTNFSAGDSFNLNDMTGFDGTYTYCVYIRMPMRPPLATRLFFRNFIMNLPWSLN